MTNGDIQQWRGVNLKKKVLRKRCVIYGQLVHDKGGYVGIVAKLRAILFQGREAKLKQYILLRHVAAVASSLLGTNIAQAFVFFVPSSAWGVVVTLFQFLNHIVQHKVCRGSSRPNIKTVVCIKSIHFSSMCIYR